MEVYIYQSMCVLKTNVYVPNDIWWSDADRFQKRSHKLILVTLINLTSLSFSQNKYYMSPLKNTIANPTQQITFLPLPSTHGPNKCKPIAIAPAPSPARVTWPLLPPKKPMLSWTHSNAFCWSFKPRFAGMTSSFVVRNPEED